MLKKRDNKMIESQSTTKRRENGWEEMRKIGRKRKAREKKIREKQARKKE